MVWKNLGSRRIRKSLEGVRVRSDIKKQQFLMVYTWCTHVQWRLKEYDVKVHVHGMVAL